MSKVTFSVPVNTGSNAITAGDVTLNSGNWNSTNSEKSSSLNTTLEKIGQTIPVLTAATDQFANPTDGTVIAANADKAVRVADFVTQTGALYQNITERYVKSASPDDIERAADPTALSNQYITRTVDVFDYIETIKTTATADLLEADTKTDAEKVRLARAIDVHNALDELAGALVAPATASAQHIDNHLQVDADGNPLTDPASGENVDPTSHRLTRAMDVEAHVQNKIDALVGGAPDALNTLGEISALLNDETDLAGKLTNTLAGKAAKAGDSGQNFSADTLRATAIAEHAGQHGLTIGKHASVANGDTWIEFDNSNHVLIKGQKDGAAVTLVTFEA